MTEASFFQNLEQQYDKKSPFVVYSRPINSIIKYWLQKDDELYETQDFKESGFVFSPFNLESSAVILPQNECEHQVLEISNLKVDKSLNSDSKINSSGQSFHINLVNKGIDAIENGELEKVVLSRSEKQPVSEHPITIFKRLFNTYKNAMVYCWYHPKVGLWLGATPELLFKVEGQQLTTISLAGTQPYSVEGIPNWTKKELEEQQIVTDFLANQISPYTTNTKISEVETIRAGNLWHLKTRLISRIDSKSELKSIIEALHPTPAVCGFPKEKAKTFILKSEGYNRQFYTGFLGELNFKIAKTRNTNRRNIENNAYSVVKTQSNFYVNLRCMQILDNTATIYVGGGITRGSVAEKEWEETQNKAKTIGNILS
ncbi:isochorismate synthase [Winogradskyella sp. PC-19]|uniref:chorismate-binding protein n=1 Tax=unclassified Winogradskyella TaxID=2615021 RepID=UPI000B3CEF3E|nr:MULTISPECIES: chorismate-binding protein [unclassified Winogradskyella]ARV08777.1 isochorismate synthase [Winogradskyella sp. PC-19]RZN77882.1 MAG: isochorismate synthase [Winogradskyella sp.]